jgi:hypothetical protein
MYILLEQVQQSLLGAMMQLSHRLASALGIHPHLHTLAVMMD